MYAVRLFDKAFGLGPGEGEIAPCIAPSGTEQRARSARPRAAETGRDAHRIMLAQRAEGLFGSSWTSFSR